MPALVQFGLRLQGLVGHEPPHGGMEDGQENKAANAYDCRVPNDVRPRMVVLPRQTVDNAAYRAASRSVKGIMRLDLLHQLPLFLDQLHDIADLQTDHLSASGRMVL